MDAAWIQVFVLVFSQCVAPPGKTVCQQEEVRYQFYSRNDCEKVLQQLITFSDSAENVIVNRDESRCLASASSQKVFASVEAVREAAGGDTEWSEVPSNEARVDFIQKAHLERLGELFECSDTGGVAPCRMGDIIVEGATVKKTDVWTQDQ